MMKRGSRGISLKRLNRIRDLIETVPQKLEKGKLRYDVLNDMARRHGISYDTIKRDLYAISYAFFPQRIVDHERYEGPLANLVDIPKSYREDVRQLRELAKKGLLDPEKGKNAAKAFLDHLPDIDKERIVRIHGITDPDIISKVEHYAKAMSRVYWYRKMFWRAHPAKAYAYAWNQMGRKIHRELENARDLAENLHRIGVKLELGMKLTKKEKEFLDELGIKESEVKNYIDPSKSLTDNLKEIYRQILDHNINYAEAVFHYEVARAHSISLYNHFKDKLEVLGRNKIIGRRPKPEELGLGDILEYTYKAIRRWPYSPNAEPRDFPEYFKRLAIDVHDGKRKLSLPLSQDELKMLHSKLGTIGYHLKAGNTSYFEFKERERRDPIMRWITKSKKRKR